VAVISTPKSLLIDVQVERSELWSDSLNLVRLLVMYVMI